MRQSRLVSATLRETPSEAEAISHQWLLRAGYIRQLAAGVYTYLPLGKRVLRKIEHIIREEMDQAEAQEILMPAMQPGELWRQSGRYDVYGPELIRFRDRHDREFVLGPTHEEVITSLVRNEVSSYRKLPVTLYQIQTKYRDERRPRYGLLRGREFLMKDAYSFDADWSGLDFSYRQMYEAYTRIFERCRLDFRAVEADPGAIGGEGGSHEFMALADIGEDTIAVCTCCDYAANVEKATSGPLTNMEANREEASPEKIHTPDVHTIDQLAEYLQASPGQFIKTLIYIGDSQPFAVLVRGDHEVNELKVKNYLGFENLELADSQTVIRVTGAPVGFAGPLGLNIPILVDLAVAAMPSGIAGANEQDYHIRDVSPARDISAEHTGDFRNVSEGDRCPRCDEGVLKFFRGIEVGHIFKLGTKYTDRLDGKFINTEGQEQAIIMGCYGIGISRLLSAIAEQSCDESGLIWPAAIAPFQVHIVPVSIKDDRQMKLANELYGRLNERGFEVLIDDRDERPGIKFKDSDLLGIPYRVVVGKQAEQGMVELKRRGGSDQLVLGAQEAVELILKSVK